MITNLHRKLFQENGVSPTLREDIIPWSESPYGAVPIVSKHFTTASAISSGEAVSTHGCGYTPGTGSLMVFMDGLCLDEGAHYAEAESGEEIALLFDCQAGVTFEFVAHDGYEYEYEEPTSTFKYTVECANASSLLSYTPYIEGPSDPSAFTVDWGDGNVEALSSIEGVKHSYAHTGTYQIAISALDSAWKEVTLMRAGTTSSSATNCAVRHLHSLDTPLPTNNLTSADSFFKRCDELESVLEDMFSKCAGLATLSNCFAFTSSSSYGGNDVTLDLSNCPNVSSASNFNTSMPVGCTIKCKAGTTTESTFSSVSGVTVEVVD